MKALTMGLWAAAAAVATSGAVWHATADGDAVAAYDVSEEGVTVVAEEPTPAPAATQVAERWRFEAGKTLRTEARLGHRRLLAEQQSETYLYVSVRAQQDDTTSPTTPLNLAIVIDRSGSMRGKRLGNAIAAAKGMTEKLRDGDTVSVLLYNTQTQVLVPPTDIDDRSRDEVVRRIDGITAVGDTCISCALDAAVDLVARRDGKDNRILLLSDGQATAGVRHVEGFRRIAAGVRSRDCSITSIGVDVDYNEQIMTAVAQESNGRHYFVDQPTELAKVFEQELESLVRTVARNAELRVDLAPGVSVEEVFDRSHRRDGSRLIVPLGAFTATDNKTLLARLRVERSSAGQRAIADVRLVYDDLTRDGESQGSCSGQLLAWITTDPDDASELDPLVAGRLSRAETSKTLREANQLFARGQVADANRKLLAHRSKVRRKAKTAVPAASAPRRNEVDQDFRRQVVALDDAYDGFENQAKAAAQPAAPNMPPKPVQQTRPGRAQVRQNASEAFDMAF